MIIVCALAALTTVLALAAHRRAWAAALGMVSGAAVVLAALVLDVSTRTMLALPVDSLRRRNVADRRALMNFTAPAFVLLFPIVLALHWMLPPSRRWVLLLAASLGFYAVGSPQALPLLAGITLGTYAAALGIAKSKTQTAKKLWLTCAAVLCIGCLCLFKYAGIFRTDVPLLLPAGISFYTFQTLSYVIDIYRGRLMPERHPGYYALFVSFFPQLVAGPIERSTALLPQLHAQERRMDSSGWLWMVRGFAKEAAAGRHRCRICGFRLRLPG